MTQTSGRRTRRSGWSPRFMVGAVAAILGCSVLAACSSSSSGTSNAASSGSATTTAAASPAVTAAASPAATSAGTASGSAVASGSPATSAAGSAVASAPPAGQVSLDAVPASLRANYTGYAGFSRLFPNPYASWTPPAPPWKICESTTDVNNSWSSGFQDELTKLVKELQAAGVAKPGFDVTISNDSTALQISQTTSLVNEGCNVIISVPGSPTALCRPSRTHFHTGCSTSPTTHRSTVRMQSTRRSTFIKRCTLRRRQSWTP